MKNLSIIFFGNTKYSTIGARIINSTHPLSLIITKKLDFNPVKNMAEKLNIPLVETDKLDQTVIERVKKQQPDFLVVEDFGLILPDELLSIPGYASLNIHHSILPKYRGPSPAPFAILNGDKVSGVTVIQMTKEVDAGDLLAQKEYVLSAKENTDSLLTTLNKMGGELLVSVINKYLKREIKPIKQDQSKATYTKHFTKQDGFFDIENPPSPEVLDRMIRAYYPWPGVWTRWKGKIVKFLPSVILTRLSAGGSEGGEGSLAHARPTYARFADSARRVGDSSSKTPQNDKILIQMEGKKVMPIQDFLNGYPDFPLKEL
ncbi:methionyl-tRNA formyltransferase [Candidatus Daviesbacteria bacterium]|nr:methionyl-tRNA formyltransferase [Candidatus Daviesbacteria bacterium]